MDQGGTPESVIANVGLIGTSEEAGSEVLGECKSKIYEHGFLRLCIVFIGQ